MWIRQASDEIGPIWRILGGLLANLLEMGKPEMLANVRKRARAEKRYWSKASRLGKAWKPELNTPRKGVNFNIGSLCM